MKLKDWAMVAEIIASVAILVTLVILIVELRGNTNAIQVATIDNVTSGWVGLNELIASDPQVARTFIVGLYNPDALTDVEAVQFSMWLRMFRNQVERVQRHHELELISESEYENALRQLAWFSETPGGRQAWGPDPVFARLWAGILQPYLGEAPYSDLMLGRDVSAVE